MKSKIILLSFVFLSVLIHGQAALNATLTTFKRPTPLIGFNGAANFCSATWTNKPFRDSVGTLRPSIIRFPGGTNSNHWDWQTGYWQVAPSTPTYVANLTNTCITRADELQLGLNASPGSKAVMVLNFQYSNINYQVQGLNYAVSKGVPVEYIELGNEHNISSSIQQYIPASTYATQGKIWADSLKANFPNAKVCMVGGAIPFSPTSGWHDSIFSKNPNIDALSFHIYLGAGNNDSKFCTKRALSMPFNTSTGATGGVASRFMTGKFTNSVVPNNIEVWATEYNMSEQLTSCPIQHAGTWTHALYLSEMSHLLMSQPKITMLLNHNVTGLVDFAAVDMGTNVLASGVAMRLLNEAARSTDSTASVNFVGQANITWSTTTYPSLIGWKFWKGPTENAWICNLSPNSTKISADEIVGTNFSYDSFYEDSTFVVQGLASLKHNLGLSSDSVTLPAFSITLLKKQSSSGILTSSQKNNFKIYPNPTLDLVTIESTIENKITKISVYDPLGRLILEKKNTTSDKFISIKIPESAGIYNLVIDTDKGTCITKIIKE